MRPIKITIKSDLNPKGFWRANHVTKYTCFSKLLTKKKLFKNLLNSRKLLTKYFGIAGSFGGQNGGGLGLKGHVARGLHTYPHGQFLSR